MTIPEWIDDKRAAWMDWPVTWKLGMGIPGALVGWLFSVQMGWSLRPCLLVGALFGMFLPLMVLNFLEATFILAIFAVIFGSIYWAFQDTEFMQGFPQYIAGILGFIWGLIMAAWEAIFG